MNNDGFITRLFVSRGVERYDAGSKRFSTDIVRAAPLAGWRLSQDKLELKVFAGPELENRILMPDIPTAEFRGTHIGARFAAELWWEPMPEMMLTSALSASTNATSHSARAAAGWRVLDRSGQARNIRIERCASASKFELAHLTGFRFDALDGPLPRATSLIAIIAAYGRIGVLTRQ